jgi:hypothetical protein
MAVAKIAATTVLMTLALAISAAHADLERLDGAGISAALDGKTISGERDGKAWVQTFDAAGGCARTGSVRSGRQRRHGPVTTCLATAR